MSREIRDCYQSMIIKTRYYRHPKVFLWVRPVFGSGSDERTELFLDVPEPGVLQVLVHGDDDPVAEVAGPDVHVLPGVVAADYRWS